MARPVRRPPPGLRQRQRADGSWRIWWEPNAPQRAAGFEPVDLDPARLTWSVREAARLNGLAAQARGGPTARAPRAARRTTAELIRLYRASPFWDALRPATQRDYAGAFRLIETKWGASGVADFTTPIVYTWYETLYAGGGRHQAASLIRKLSVLMTYAVRIGWREHNPCLRIGIRTPRGRHRVADWAELDALLRAAGPWPSMRLAIALAAFQGQRQTDLIEARREDFSGDYWRFLRSKRGNLGALPLHEEVRAPLAAVLAIPTDAATLLVHEGTGRAYSPDLFRKTWARIRATAAAEAPTLATLQFRDLRRTFGHLARLGGADPRQVADALGNSAWTDPQLSGTYMPATTETAARAVAAIRRPKAGGE